MATDEPYAMRVFEWDPVKTISKHDCNSRVQVSIDIIIVLACLLSNTASITHTSVIKGVHE